MLRFISGVPDIFRDQVKTYKRMVSQMCLFLIPVLMKSTSTVQKHFDAATRKPTAW